MMLRKNLRVLTVLWLGATLLMAACGAAQADEVAEEALPEVSFEHEEYILSAQQVADLLDAGEDADLVILDARGTSDYQSEHVPGAVHLPPSRLDREGGDFPFQVLPAEEMAPLLQGAGINQDSQVIIYDSGGTFNAARVWWVLDYYGLTEKAVLDGGFTAWLASGGEMSRDVPDVTPGDFVPVPDPTKIADYQYVLDHIGSDATSVCDARQSSDFEEGAVPGAVNLPYTETFAGSGELVKDAASLQMMFEAVDLDRDEEIIFYCIGGYLSSQDYLLARAMGYERVRLYDGSITEWNQRDGPTEPGGGS